MNTTSRSLLKTLPILAVTGLLAWTLHAKDAPPKLSLKIDDATVPRTQALPSSFSPIVKRVGPSVVKVVTSAKMKMEMQGQSGDPMDNPLLRRFFGDPFGQEGSGRGQQRMPKVQGLGSGVIVTEDGYILTNNHVVESADTVRVTLADGREFTAKVVGKDPKSDVAVVKVEATGLPAITLADSDKIEVGDVVLAVGNPFGIGQTVTSGIISATGRTTLGLDYEDFIQTDAAINPGNSGGALIDISGRLIGINTAILSRSGGNQGIGFSIPVNLARDVMESLVRDGKVTRGFIGVRIQDVDPSLARQFKLGEPKGALIADVTPKGAAEKGGLRSGDVVSEVNGREVRDSQHLKNAVARVKPGEVAALKVIRDGETRIVKVKVGERPDDGDVAEAEPAADSDNGTLNGVGVADLDSRNRREHQIPESVKGAVITTVEPQSPSAEAGLQPGDVILEINREKVTTAEEAVRLTEHPKDKTTLLKLWTRRGIRFVVVDEGSEKKSGR
jgi:serine protease Do